MKNLSDKKNQLNKSWQGIFARILTSYTQILSYHSTCVRGLEKIGKELHSENFDFIIPELEKFNLNKSDIAKNFTSYNEFCAQLSAQMTQNTLNQSIIVLDSSVIIIMQSILDITLSECIYITFDLDYEFWEKRIDNNPIKFKEFMKYDKEIIFKKRLEAKRKSIDRKSINDKIKLLLPLCENLRDKAYVKEYKLDLDLLKKYDEKRHELIHCDFKKIEWEDPLNIVEYFKNTALFFCLVIREKYCFYVDHDFPKLISKYSQQPYNAVEVKKKENEKKN